jgi:TM2 domain
MTKSKTLATWIALVGGAVGLHRFYLHGLRDWKGWLHPLPTFLGFMGIQRVQRFGLDDNLAWWLIPLGGVSITVALLCAIVYGLTPDERWDARHNAGNVGTPASGWGAVIGVVISLLVGATVMISTISISIQHAFEAQAEGERTLTR